MANTLSGFFQTLVAGVTEATKLLAPTHAAHKQIYWDTNPAERGALGNTINVPIPADPTANVSDIGTGDVQLSDINFTTTPIVYDRHPEFGYVVRDFEQFKTPLQIRNVFADAALKGIKNSINGVITSLFTTANFTTNSAISATGGAVTTTQFTGAMAVLADQNVPVQNDVANMSVLLPSVPYTKILDPTTGGTGAAWSQAFIAGNRFAEEIRATGKIPVAFATQFWLDQQMPTSGAVGARTFTGAYFHRYAVAGVSRPLPDPDGKVVDFTFIDWDGISLRVQVGYNQFPKGGFLVTIDAGYGLKVVRENMGVLFSVAE